MPTRKIVYIDDERLRQQANPVKQFTADLEQLARDMFETMRAHQGLGLAGPQIGAMQRILVAEIPLPTEDNVTPHPLAGQPFVLVNPEIVDSAETMVEGEEGCLSIPGLRGLVARPEWVEVEGQNLEGQPFRMRAEALLARIFMHEIDHLNGVLFIDHIHDQTKLWSITEQVPVQPRETQPGAPV